VVCPKAGLYPSFVVGARLASSHGPSKTALSPHMPFRQRTASVTRKMLTPERLRHQKSADTRKAPAPERLWCYTFADATHLLVLPHTPLTSRRFGHPDISDIQKVSGRETVRRNFWSLQESRTCTPEIDRTGLKGVTRSQSQIRIRGKTS
jgi:hypothetical protein